MKESVSSLPNVRTYVYDRGGCCGAIQPSSDLQRMPMPGTLADNDWTLLLQRIRAGKCTPFLGSGACYGHLPVGCEVAEKWASEYGYPVPGPRDLIGVSQYLAVNMDPVFPKELVCTEFQVASPPDFDDPDEPHSLLAELPLPIFITTNYDHYMVSALRAKGKVPRQDLCRWNKLLKDHRSVFDDDPGFVPTIQNPLVFHMHGHLDVPESIVITDDDYLDFIMNLSKDSRLLPHLVERAFANTSLLFVGYSIADWDFRIIFRSLVAYLEKSISRTHISVQLVPGGSALSDAERVKVQEYLDRYFGILNIKVYWGDAREFARELRQRWEAF